MAEVRIKDIDEHEIDTILAEDIDFEGHLTFKKPLMIKGKFKGEIKSTSALYIGEKAYVEATTEAAIVSSRGRHKGDIVAHSRIELYSTAQVDGDVTTPDFVMESGCRFNGYCNMGGGSPAEKKGPSTGQTQAAPGSTPPPGVHAAGAPSAHPSAPASPAGAQSGPVGQPNNPQGPRPGTPPTGAAGQQK